MGFSEDFKNEQNLSTECKRLSPEKFRQRKFCQNREAGYYIGQLFHMATCF